MSEEKMSSDEVPRKFTEWLLSMGCPADIVPSQDKMTEMCRGQYHMVWRSLMEQVDVRDVVREKRMQVFCDDIRRCRKNNVFSQQDLASIIVPEQLSLWKQQSDLMKSVWDAKSRLALVKRDLDHLMEKVSTKMCSRLASRARVENASRRAWLLRQVADELAAKKANLQETRDIADSLCETSDDRDEDIKARLDKCLELLHPQLSQGRTSEAPCGDVSEQAYELLRGGAALCERLYERRAVLVKELTCVQDAPKDKNIVTPQSVLAHTAALHCSLSLEATKNKLHLKQTRKRLLATVTDLNNYLSGEACELVVVRCERSHSTARVAALRALLDDVTGNTGAFHTHGGPAPKQAAATTHSVDKAIESKREELLRVVATLIVTERKIQTARDCLLNTLAAFHTDGHAQHTTYRDIQLELPSESIPSLREFYARRREAGRRRVDLSMDLEASEGSLLENIDYSSPTFVDELRFYLKKFNLGNNRQLVLESGSKIWIFESARASLARCPPTAALSLVRSTFSLARSAAATRQELAATLRAAGNIRHIQPPSIDISNQKEEEQQIVDRIKKRIRESLLELLKTNKTFVLAEDNLKFWADNNIRKYISTSRKHDGMTYRDYEVYYNENCLNVAL